MMKLALIVLLLFQVQGNGAVSWEGKVPSFAQDAGKWKSLVGYLKKREMHGGVRAASERMLSLFTDLSAKEFAYQNLLDLIESGYPYSLQEPFDTGDLDPDPNSEFAKSYYLYKAIFQQSKGMGKWASSYFEKLKGDRSPKSLMFQALQSYEAKDLKSAEFKLKRILAGETSPNQIVLVSRAARTLARIYFEKREFRKALEIYQTFLLALNPVSPNDWLETAWNLYYLERYPEALGMLYNLESPVFQNEVGPEKYLLRALIYQATCQSESVETLISEFNERYSGFLNAVKNGLPLNNLALLQSVLLPSAQEANHLDYHANQLQEERQRVGRLPRSLRPLATYLYDASLLLAKNELRMKQEGAQRDAAEHLVNLGETLRYIKFDLSRKKIESELADPAERVVSSQESKQELPWKQNGFFWRNERLQYVGVLESKCSGNP